MHDPSENPAHSPCLNRRYWIAIAIVAVLVGSSLGIWLSSRTSQTTFDAGLWKAANSSKAFRVEMVDDLLQRYKLVGMTRKEIDDLLGVPPETAYFSGFDYVYWLGPERGFISIDSEWLCIKFENDTVVEARVMRD